MFYTSRFWGAKEGRKEGRKEKKKKEKKREGEGERTRRMDRRKGSSRVKYYWVEMGWGDSVGYLCRTKGRER